MAGFAERIGGFSGLVITYPALGPGYRVVQGELVLILIRSWIMICCEL